MSRFFQRISERINGIKIITGTLPGDRLTDDSVTVTQMGAASVGKSELTTVVGAWIEISEDTTLGAQYSSFTSSIEGYPGSDRSVFASFTYEF